MLEVKNISSGYGKKQVLYDVSLKVKPGEVVLLTGGNGSGKSTLLKCICNLLPLGTGSIEFQGRDTKDKRPSELIHNGIVYIPQKDYCFENLTVHQNLEISATIYSSKQLNQRIEKVYEVTGLEKLKKRRPFNLSGGETKLLALGMGLIHNPRLILLDEPLAGIDSKGTDKILNLIEQNFLSPNNCIIIVEHKDLKRKLFTKKVVMELGRIKTILI